VMFRLVVIPAIIRVSLARSQILELISSTLSVTKKKFYNTRHLVVKAEEGVG
jgi:hypothetical protein